MKLIKKRRRSLVRIFASCIPDFLWKFLLPVPPRMCISFSVMERILSLRQNVHSDDENFSSYRSHVTSNSEPKLVYSTSLKNTEKNSRIKELQQEIDVIQQQISKIMKINVTNNSSLVMDL